MPQLSEKKVFTEALIDTSTKKSIDKAMLLELLKSHNVETESVEDPETSMEEVISTLIKAKVNLPEAFFEALACETGFPFINYLDVKKIYKNEQKSKLISILPFSVVSKYKIIPLEIAESAVVLAVDNPLNRRVMVTLQFLFRNMEIELYVASSKAIDWAIENLYSKVHKQEAILELCTRTPNQSAYKVLYPNQKAFIIFALVAAGLSAFFSFTLTFVVLFSVMSIGYFVTNPIKIYISLKGFKGARAHTKITETKMHQIPDKDLPVYTVLIPLFHETNVLAQNMRNMYQIDYPREKLDIKILMEEKDEETITEAKQIGLFGSPIKFVEGIPREEYIEFLKLFDPIIIPSADITTKPRACNYGLLRAKGELCVIYDAEDKPDPDQLRKAAILFKRLPQKVVCLQSKLNFYNANQNLLTKWFSIEYENWFEFYLQGLDWINAPIPLGGTSNHFRKKSLDTLGRWDPYNVTEDADIGIRLARRKLKTQIIETYTLEEATAQVPSWVRQRSRWYKGHFQTYLVHMRYPRKLFKDLGLSQFLKFQFTFGGSIFVPLINPVFWVIFAITLFMPLPFGSLIPGYVALIGIINLTAGNLSYVSMYVISCIKTKKYRQIPLAFLMPLYWVLVSIASWKGLLQLITKPFYWDKTTHGISRKHPSCETLT